MSGQVRVTKVKTGRRGDVSTDWTAPKDAQKDRTQLKAELDELLAEVDAALEGIDEDLAVKYRQHGGE
jgi:uncharacterized membrane protein YqiK